MGLKGAEYRHLLKDVALQMGNKLVHVVAAEGEEGEVSGRMLRLGERKYTG